MCFNSIILKFIVVIPPRWCFGIVGNQVAIQGRQEILDFMQGSDGRGSIVKAICLGRHVRCVYSGHLSGMKEPNQSSKALLSP